LSSAHQIATALHEIKLASGKAIFDRLRQKGTALDKDTFNWSLTALAQVKKIEYTTIRYGSQTRRLFFPSGERDTALKRLELIRASIRQQVNQDGVIPTGYLVHLLAASTQTHSDIIRTLLKEACARDEIHQIPIFSTNGKVASATISRSAEVEVFQVMARIRRYLRRSKWCFTQQVGQTVDGAEGGIGAILLKHLLYRGEVNRFTVMLEEEEKSGAYLYFIPGYMKDAQAWLLEHRDAAKKFDYRKTLKLRTQDVKLGVFSQRLKLRPEVAKMAYQMLRRLEKRGLKGFKTELVTASCLFLASRICNYPIAAKELASKVHPHASRSKMRAYCKDIFRISKIVQGRLRLSTHRIMVQPQVLIDRIVLQLGLTADKQTALSIKTKELYDKVPKPIKTSGRNPRSIISALLYLASKELGFGLRQRELAQACNITEVSLRNAYNKLRPIVS
jgi:transcription initiation factor TFIIIB Brf1 subunit/transcription initiation factor TFIIB